DPSSLRMTSRAFVAAAFDALHQDDVIPTPSFHPYVRVGRDYYGPEIMALEQYRQLERELNDAYPNRFADPLKRRHAEFASTYIFSLLEASVARCGHRHDFAHDSPAVDESISEMLSVLDAESYEVVCCRVVSHFTTKTGQPLRVGPIEVVPEDRGSRSLERAIGQRIPGALAAFNRDPPFAHDPPHSLLVAREQTKEDDPYAVAERLSTSLERFLLHMRLLTAGTVQSYYEMKGTTTLVSRMPPYLTTFVKGTLDSPIRRTVRVSGTEGQAIAAIGKLIDDADVQREGMVMTSFDIALGRYQGSYRTESAFDHLVDLATALEAALAAGEEDNEGLTLRLRNRAAALLATESDPAPSIFADVGLLYSLRSKVVHGGQMKQKDLRRTIDRISTVPTERPTLMPAVALGHAVGRMRDLVRRAILARLCLAAPPDPPWPITAADVPVDALLAHDPTRGEWRDRWHERLVDLHAAEAADPPRTAADFLSPDER